MGREVACEAMTSPRHDSLTAVLYLLQQRAVRRQRRRSAQEDGRRAWHSGGRANWCRELGSGRERLGVTLRRNRGEVT